MPNAPVISGPGTPPAFDGSAARNAVLFVSFGGPESADEVVPFLQRVTAGRGIPAERLRMVGQHYFERGGVSPINQLCRDMIAELEAALGDAEIDLPVYWGNRNSAPFLADTLATMASDGVTNAFAFVTSAYSSYSGCRQYREDLARAQAEVGPTAPAVQKLRTFFNHPGFIDPLVDGLERALAAVDPARTQVLFTAHSIPTAMAEGSFYVDQLNHAVELICERTSVRVRSALVWQSRSGPAAMPWLEPDIVDAIGELDASETDSVVVVPVGFVSDHMEVLQDLDTDAARAAEAGGFVYERVATPGTDPRFIAMIVELVREQIHSVVPVAIGGYGLVPQQCDEFCCPPPLRPDAGQTV